MAFHIDDIRSALVHGGWRPSHFQVIITNPYDTSADLKIPFMVRAAQLPTYVVGKVPVYYFGRAIFVPGDRSFDEGWTTTVINDEDFVIKNSLEIWHNKINAVKANVSSTNVVNELKSIATVTAYGKDGRTLRVYQLNGLWPVNISAIEADWQATDTIAEYQVTWSFDDLEIIGGVTGDGGNI